MGRQRAPLMIWACVPLAIIGISIGLLVTQKPFGFMALLGMLSLTGMLIKNGIVLEGPAPRRRASLRFQNMTLLIDGGFALPGARAAVRKLSVPVERA